MGWVGKKKSTAGQLAGTANELTKEVLERAVHRESPVIRPDVVVGTRRGVLGGPAPLGFATRQRPPAQITLTG